MKKFTTLACLVLISVGVSACSNTLNGAGKDIEKAGDKIQKTF